MHYTAILVRKKGVVDTARVDAVHQKYTTGVVELGEVSIAYRIKYGARDAVQHDFPGGAVELVPIVIDQCAGHYVSGTFQADGCAPAAGGLGAEEVAAGSVKVKVTHAPLCRGGVGGAAEYLASGLACHTG